MQYTVIQYAILYYDVLWYNTYYDTIVYYSIVYYIMIYVCIYIYIYMHTYVYMSDFQTTGTGPWKHSKSTFTTISTVILLQSDLYRNCLRSGLGWSASCSLYGRFS